MTSHQPSRRDRVTGHAIVAVAVVLLVAVAAESARQSLQFSVGPRTVTADSADVRVPATLPPAPLATPVPVINNANAVGSVEHPAGPKATGPAMATVSADAPRTVIVGPAFAAPAPIREDTLAGEPTSPSVSLTASPASAPSSGGVSQAASIPPTDTATAEPIHEPTPEPTPKPDKPKPTHPPHPQSPSPEPTESEQPESDPPS